MLIMNKDRIVARSFPTGGPVKGFRVEPDATYMDVPLVLFRKREEVSWQEFYDWVIKRCFPRTRVNADVLLRSIGLSSYEPWAIVTKTNAMLPMEDDFWVDFNNE